MAFIPPFFKNFGKAVSDLFKEQFDYTRQLKIKSKTANGVELESSVKGGSEGTIKATYKQHEIGTLQAELHTTPSTTYSIKNDRIVKGMVVKLSGDEKPSGKVEIDYSQDHIATSLSADVASSTAVDTAVVAGFDGLSVGGHFKYDVSAQQAKDYNVGAEYAFGASDITLTFKTLQSLSRLSLGYLHRHNAAIKVGAQVVYDLKDNKHSLVFGGSYLIDHSATVKAKIDIDGTFGSFPAVLEHKLSYPASKLVLSVEDKAKLASIVPQSFGVALHLGDN